MPKRKYQDEDKLDDSYVDVECPVCDATINVRFQKGRNSRRLRCPVCAKLVTLTLPKEPFPQDLIQLK
jgi:transposase